MKHNAANRKSYTNLKDERYKLSPKVYKCTINPLNKIKNHNLWFTVFFFVVNKQQDIHLFHYFNEFQARKSVQLS